MHEKYFRLAKHLSKANVKILSSILRARGVFGMIISRIAITKCSHGNTCAMEKEEKECVLKFFKIDISHGVVPGKTACMQCIQENAVLKNMDWKKIKYCIKNEIAKRRKLYTSISK
ncbi:hypothetical protein RI129_000132 [Pyrocoelia pectoralis]|uniref:Uncharacterized protein n=1 Tax=Pyrocoelia pectoralis TaxID=417401 RepID=A0AAN7V5P3_9COLE